MARAPDQRYPSAREMQGALTLLSGSGSHLALTDTRDSRPGGWPVLPPAQHDSITRVAVAPPRESTGTSTKVSRTEDDVTRPLTSADRAQLRRS